MAGDERSPIADRGTAPAPAPLVLDASVLIAHLDARHTHHQRAGALLETAVAAPLGASTVTIAEVLVGPARAGRLEEARAALTRLGLREIGLGEEAAPRLATIRAETGLKLPDCCVLLAGEDGEARGVASFDDRLSAVAAGMGLHRPEG